MARTFFSWDRIALVGAVLLGAVLRIVAVAWGAPERLHPDEGVIFDGAVDLANRNSFEPSVSWRPDHVEIQLSYLTYMAWSHLVLH